MKNKMYGYALMLFGSAALLSTTLKPAPVDDFINLQVLPKNISAAELDKIMESFNEALGVSCDYCHAKDANKELVFHLDTKSEKETTRKMMRMTEEINKKYFSFGDGEDIRKAVTCYTCHYENPIPAVDSMSMKRRF